jgi:hypothetical protein
VTGLIKSLTEKFGNTLELSNFYSPKGLNIGGNSDEEIALVISPKFNQSITNSFNINNKK